MTEFPPSSHKLAQTCPSDSLCQQSIHISGNGAKQGTNLGHKIILMNATALLYYCCYCCCYYSITFCLFLTAQALQCYCFSQRRFFEICVGLPVKIGDLLVFCFITTLLQNIIVAPTKWRFYCGVHYWQCTSFVQVQLLDLQQLHTDRHRTSTM